MHKRILFFLLFVLGNTASTIAQDIHACTVMPAGDGSHDPTTHEPGNFGLDRAMPSPPLVQKAVAIKPKVSGYSNYWTNGSTVRVKFLGGSEYVRRKVVQYANEWTRYANLTFKFVTTGPSDIRVSFVNNGSSWSMIGQQARSAPANRATMNFGWFHSRTPEAEFRRTILHEFGHALGLLHEHQNPTGGIPWDEGAVYDFYARTQGWDRRTTYDNVMARRTSNDTQFTRYDPASIMHYPVSPRLTGGRYQVGMNDALSATDIAFVANMYPGRNHGNTADRPTPPPRTKPRPDRPAPTAERPTAGRRYTVSVSNKLGSQQRAEVVHLYIDGKKHTFTLRADQRREQTVQLQLKPGNYDYRLETASVYATKQRVWNGRRYVDKVEPKTIYGAGKGTIQIKGNGALTLYGDYDQQSKRMRVYLGKVS